MVINIERDIKEKGFIDAPALSGKELRDEIDRLRREKNVVILAHYYQRSEVQDIADFTGDSLALSREAAETDAGIILFAGVHFMAETAKILSPEKKVLLPDLNAGCSMADSCPADEFEKFIRKNPGRTVITYVNTTAEVKTLSDIVCTSSNAVRIVNSLPESEKIIFAPDRNLGQYVRELTRRKDMLIWDGSCHVHRKFSRKKIMVLKKKYPYAKIIAHPECEKEVREVSEYLGSTAQLVEYTKKDKGKTYIVATEPGVIHEMKKHNPEKEYIPAPPTGMTACVCSECEYMKMITLEKIYNTLKYELPEVTLEEEVIRKAVIPIKRMLEITGK